LDDVLGRSMTGLGCNDTSQTNTTITRGIDSAVTSQLDTLNKSRSIAKMALNEMTAEVGVWLLRPSVSLPASCLCFLGADKAVASPGGIS
jgi:excinuclease UvrABC helicase subunit UvrB